MKKFLTFLNLYKNFSGGSRHSVKWLCKTFGFNLNQKIFMTDIYVRVSMVKFLTEFSFDNFEKIKKTNISKLIQTTLYRGRRHAMNLPVNGQRTHTNAKTRKKRHVT